MKNQKGLLVLNMMKTQQKKSVFLLSLLLLLMCGCSRGTAEPEEYDFIEVREGWSYRPSSVPHTEYDIRRELWEALGIGAESHYSQWPGEIGSIDVHNGFVVVNLTEFTQENIEKYCAMVSDASCLRFARARFSYIELCSALERISSEISGYPGYVFENFTHMVNYGICPRFGKDPHLELDITGEYFDIIRKYCAAEYGSIVKVTKYEL